MKRNLIVIGAICLTAFSSFLIGQNTTRQSSIPVFDIAMTYTDKLGYTTFQLKDYGNINDCKGNRSYSDIQKEIWSNYESVLEDSNKITVHEFNGNSWTMEK